MARLNYGVKFNGKNIVHPGGYDHIDASAMEIVGDGTDNIPIVLGEADSGIPGIVKWFTNSSDAKEYLRGGDLYHAVDMMFNPKGETGASIVGVLVTNATQQAKLTEGSLVIGSKEYGDGGNRIQVNLSEGSMSGTKTFSVNRWDIGKSEVYDNVGAIIKLKYTGEQAYASVEVTKSGTDSIKIITKIGADKESAQEDVSLDLSTGRYKDVDSIIKYFQSLSDYSASYVNYRNSGMSYTGLDALEETDIKQEATILGVKGDLQHQVNNYSELVEISYVEGDLQNVEYKYLSGGKRGESPASWHNYFAYLQKQYANILVILSSSEAIHAECLEHIKVMLDRKQKRVMFTGGGLVETVAKAKERAFMLNDSRAVTCYPGVYYPTYKEGKEPLPAYMSAALVAGVICGLSPSEPITFDTVNCIGLANDLLAGDADVDDLITSGVLCLERVLNEGIRIVQGITTYLDTNNTLYREISVRRGADAVSDFITNGLEKAFVGKKGLRSTPSAVETKTMDLLDLCIKSELITGYRNIIVKYVNTAVYVDFEVAPVEPINYILVTSHFVPDSTLQ